MSGPTLGDNLPLVILLLGAGVLGGMWLQKQLWRMRRGNRQRWDRRERKGGKMLPFQP